MTFFCSELSRFEIIYETFSFILGAPQGGSLTPPPPNLSSLGIFGATAQRFSNAPGSDRAAAAAAAAFGGPQAALAAAAAAAAGLGIRNGNTGAGINPLGGGANMNLIGSPANIFNSNPVGQVNKMRHSSSEKAASNRSKLLEDFRYVVRLQEYLFITYLIVRM